MREFSLELTEKIVLENFVKFKRKNLQWIFFQVKLEDCVNNFTKETCKQEFLRVDFLQGKFLSFFLVDAIKTAFQMRHLTHRWTQSGYFALKSGLFFDFKKRAGKASPLLAPFI